MKTPIALCVVRRGGLVLGVTRKHDHHSWGLPGGKVDPGEAPLVACLRELREETGIELLKPRLIYAGYLWNRRVYCATGTPQGEIHTAEAGLAQWVTPQRITSNWRDNQILLDLAV